MKRIHILDVVKIVFCIDFIAAGLFLVLNSVRALVPSLQTMTIAAFVDQVILSALEGGQYIKTVVLIMVLVTLAAYNWIIKGLTEFLGQHIEIRLREVFKPRLIEKISNLKYEAMEHGDTRDKITRVSTNVEGQILDAYSSLLHLLELILKLAGVLLIIFLQVWWLAFAVFAVAVPCFYIAMKSGKEDYEAQSDVTRINRVNEYYNEMLVKREYVDERTVFGYQEVYRKKFLQQYEESRRYTTKVRFKWFLKMKVGSMAVILVSAFFLAIMIPLTLNGRLSFGMFMALTNAVFGIVQNMSWDLTYNIDRNTWYNEYFKELGELLAMEEVDIPEDKGEKEGNKSRKKIGEFHDLEFKNVSFRYPGIDSYILKNLSFKIEAGRKYAFVGANGAGKTTIMKLLNRLYEEYEGEILVNGEDIRNIDKNVISNVFQDFARYPISIRKNMIIARQEDVSETELIKVLEEVDLKKTVMELKDGLDTILGKVSEDSLDLSGGEWQKIAMVRCILSKAPVYILDEPTAAMDPIYESKIYHKFQKLSKGKTVLLISHRLASVKMTDHIFVIEDGTVVESGSHLKLMEENGLYKTMYEEQAKWYEEEGKERAHEQ